MSDTRPVVGFTNTHAVLILLACALGIVAGWYLKPDTVATEYRTKTREVVSVQRDTIRDTVRVPILREAVRIVEAPTRVVYDTNARPVPVRPFVATLDTTTAKGDTVRASVAYTPPAPPTLSVLILHRPDTATVETLSTREVLQFETVKTEPARPWYVEALVVVGAGAVGYVAGRVAP